MKKTLQILLWLFFVQTVKAQDLYLTDGNGETVGNVFYSNTYQPIYISGCTGTSFINPIAIYIVPNTFNTNFANLNNVQLGTENPFSLYTFCGSIQDELIHVINPNDNLSKIPGKYNLVIHFVTPNNPNLFDNNFDVILSGDNGCFFEIVDNPAQPIVDTSVQISVFKTKVAALLEYYSKASSMQDAIQDFEEEISFYKNLYTNFDLLYHADINGINTNASFFNGENTLRMAAMAAALLEHKSLAIRNGLSHYWLRQIRYCSSIARKSSLQYLGIANDPPRFDYNTLESFKMPLSNNTGMYTSEIQQKAIELTQLIALEDTILVDYLHTLERIQGAETDNEITFLRLQNRHFKKINQLLIDINIERNKIFNYYKTLPNANTLRDTAAIMQYRNQLQNQGFYPSDSILLSDLGYTNADIQILKNEILSVNPNPPYLSLNQLADSVILHDNSSIANFQAIVDRCDSVETLFANDNNTDPFPNASITGPSMADVGQPFTLQSTIQNQITPQVQQWKPSYAISNALAINEQYPGYYLYEVTQKNAIGGVMDRAYKLVHINMPNISIPVVNDTSSFYKIYEGDTLTLLAQQNLADANGLTVVWTEDEYIIPGANQNRLQYIAERKTLLQPELHLIKAIITHPAYPQLSRTQTWLVKVMPETPYTFFLDSNGIAVSSNVIYMNHFEAPNITPDIGTCAFDLDIIHSINQLWSGTGLGVNANAIFSHSNTVETILVNGPFNQYNDPQGIGGNFALGLQNFVQHDQVGLTFNVLSYPYINTYLDLSAIGLNGCGLTGAPLDTAKIRLTLYNTPSGIFDINNPGTILDSVTLSGNYKGVTDFTFNWKRVQSTLKTIGNTNGNVTLQFEVTNSAYAAIDNLLIESAIDSIPSLSSLCNGSFGTPIVNTSFGAGANTDLPTAVPNATTTYGYDPNCPNNGLYSITNTSVFSCAQFVSGGDHTGDLNGRMMVVNADANQAGEFYKQKMDGLCAGTTYQLAAWFANLTSPSASCGSIIPANVKFEVYDAATLNSLGFANTGNLPITANMNWQQNHFEFTAISDSVILVLKNNGLGGCGNDLAIDDITLRACSEGRTINISSVDTNVCLGNSATIYGSVVSDDTLEYQWQKSSNNGVTWTDIAGATTLDFTITNFQATDNAFYRLSAAPAGNIGSVNCRFVSSSNGIQLKSKDLSIANFTSVITGNSVVFNNTSNNTIFNYWSFGDETTDTATHPLHQYVEDGTYQVSLLTSNVCGQTDTATATLSICNHQPLIHISGSSKFCATTGTRLVLETCHSDSIVWYKNNIALVGETRDSLDVISSGLYKCSVKNNGVWITSDSIVIQSVQVPIADFTYSQSCLNMSATNNSSNAQSYVWTFGDSTSSSIINPSHVYSSVGQYTLLFSAINDICIDTQSVQIHFINAPTYHIITVTSCNQYSYNSKLFTQSGTYKDTLTNATGCDSIVTLNLTIKQQTASTQTVATCGSYVFNGQTFTASGIFKDTLTNAAGCDSIVTLNLTIKQPTASTQTVSSCGSYFFNGQTLTASGIFKDTSTNAAGCDSIVTLNLTIKQPTASTQTVSSCGSYFFNGQTLTASGIFKDTLTNAAGCDSIITLNLTINVNPSPTVTASGYHLTTQNFAGYQWQLNGNNIVGATSQNYTATANGSYAVEVTDANGCLGTSSAVNITGVGINNIQQNEILFTIYPNPATSVLHINCNTEGPLQTKVLSASGQLVSAFQFERSIILNIEDLAQGVYFIQCVDKNGTTSTQRFLKE